MNSANPNLGKEAIDNRFIRAVIALMDTGIATTQGEIAQALGVKSAKFSEIMNGRMHVGVDMLSELSEEYLVAPEWLLTGRGGLNVPPIINLATPNRFRRGADRAPIQLRG